MKKCLNAFVFLFLVYCVTDYNSRMAKQYAFPDDIAKQNYLKSIIVNETDSDEPVSFIISELSLIPDNVWKNFFKNGGQIVITNNLPDKNVAGTFSIKSIGNYIIYVSPDYIEYALLHEIGHYLGFMNNIKNDGRFAECLSERGLAINGVLQFNEYFYEDAEYFAEMTKLYFHNELDPADFPLFISYIEHILSSYQ